MGKIIKNSSGKVLSANGGAFQVDASIDSNIVAGNIKEGVSILGVEGTLSGPKPVNDVNFYDYDGTIVASYSAADFANLTAMPSNPIHDGLTAQGWNWPLADAKTYVAKYGHLEVGQMYATTDGKTHLYCSIENEYDPTFSFKVYASAIGDIFTVEWGDGSVENITTTQRKQTLTHTYASAGNYIVKVSSAASYIFSGADSLPAAEYYRTTIRRIELPASGVTIGWQGLGGYLYGLEALILPQNSVTSNSRFLYNCKSKLIHLTMPTGTSGMTDTTSMFNCSDLRTLSLPYDFTGSLNLGWTSLQRLTAPDGMTGRIEIPSTVQELDLNWPETNFYFSSKTELRKLRFCNQTLSFSQSWAFGATSLTELIIPEGVTYIPDLSYNSCLTYVDYPSTTTELRGNGLNGTGTNPVSIFVCRATTPPTTHAANFIYSTIQAIYVPYSADHSVLAAYKAATNWLNYESQIYELDANGNIPSE